VFGRPGDRVIQRSPQRNRHDGRTFDTSGSGAGALVTGDLIGAARATAVLEGDCVTTRLTRVTTQVDAHVGL
jgi:hypothetical protein